MPVTRWYALPKVASQFPQYAVNPERCGFYVHFNMRASHRLDIQIGQRCVQNPKKRAIQFRGFKPAPSVGYPGEDGLSEFIRLANENHFKVLEIGAREISNQSRRHLFQDATYVGFDIPPGTNVDVVGDAHKLSSYFEPESFDAIFSLAVMEHLAMPWLAVLEMNKVLKAGGITYHQAPCLWPLHERPWDFWRFTDYGLKVLFSRPMGFEVLSVGLHGPLRVYLDELSSPLENLPFGDGFGNACVLARKVETVDLRKTRWEVDIEDVVEPGSTYVSQRAIDDALRKRLSEGDGICHGEKAPGPSCVQSEKVVSSLVALGQKLIEQNRIPEARRCLEDAYRSNPTNVTAALMLSMTFVVAEESDKAMEILDDVLSRRNPLPVRAMAFYQKGLVYKRRGQTGRAQEFFRRALLADPTHCNALVELALMMKESGDAAAAERMLLERALSLDLIPIWETVGNYFMRLGQYQKAADLYLEIVDPLAKEMDVDRIVSARSLILAFVRTCLKAKRKEVARTYLNRFEALFGQDPEFRRMIQLVR